MEFFLIIIGLFGLIGLLTGIGSGTHDSHPVEDNDPFDNNLIDEDFYRHRFLDDTDGTVDVGVTHDSDDGLLDPFPTTLSDNLFDTDHLTSTSGLKSLIEYAVE